MSQKTLVVCGDSYMSPVLGFPGKHFSEILASKLGYELIPLSRGGMSNGGIALQLESAAELKPDLVLVGTTYSPRIEYPIKNSTHDKIENSKSLLYRGSDSMSSQIENEYVGSEPILASTNINKLLVDEGLPYFPYFLRQVDDFEEKVNAIRKWFEYLYHDGWKTKQDQLMLYASLHKIDLLNINYIICFDYIELAPTCPWIKNNVSKEFMDRANTVSHNIQQEIPFHTTLEMQEEFADIIINKIKG